MNKTPALLESKESGLFPFYFIYLLWATQEKQKVQLVDGLEQRKIKSR